MKEIITMWVVFQLVVIGIAGVSINNQVINKTYKCESKELPVLIGAIHPLAMFVPEPHYLIDYCKNNTPL